MISFYIIEACVCAAIFFLTKDIFILNILLICFAGLKCLIEFVDKGFVYKSTGILSSIIAAASLATIYYHNPVFLKWKALMFVFAASIFILMSPNLTKRPATYYIIRRFLNLNKKEHASFNYYSGMLGLSLAVLNLLVSKKCTDEQWFFFKTVFSPLVILGFVCIQLFIYRDKLKCSKDNSAIEVE